MKLETITMYPGTVLFLVTASWISAAPGNLTNVQRFETEPAKDIHPSIIGKSWEMFKAKYGKQYQNREEESYRLSNFAENIKQIYFHNQKYKKGETTYWLGLNHFSDLRSDEFRAMYTGCAKTRANLAEVNCSTFLSAHNTILPDKVNSTERGSVTPVKNQGLCGSCWAFSTAGSLEGQNFRKTGKLISLSEQQLVDCSKTFENLGCHGGLMDPSFAYIKKNDIEAEEGYPYKGKDGNCVYDVSKVVTKDTGCVDIKNGSESALQEIVATVRPISVAIDASSTLFQLYQGEVYQESDCSTTDLNHAVLVVGYGTDEGQDYWLANNSWSEYWGLDGYIKMARNKGNMCGIATEASYPLL